MANPNREYILKKRSSKDCGVGKDYLSGLKSSLVTLCFFNKTENSFPENGLKEERGDTESFDSF